MNKLMKNQKGISLVIVTLAMVSILGCAAIVTDVGLTIIQKQKLSNAIDAAALAAVFPITGASGVRPLAVEKFDFQFGTEYVLKQGAGGSYNGNFGAVALGGKGANNYRNNIKYGYGGLLRIGDWVSTEPGNMSGPTQESIDYLMNQCSHTPKCTISQYDPSCPRVITIPIVNTLEVN